MTKLETKKLYWYELIKEQEKSGLSQRAFCKQNNLKFHQLHHYRHLLKQEKLLSSEALKDKIVPIQIKAVPNKIMESKEIRLILQNGMQCILPSEMEFNRIGQLVGVLLSC